MISPEPGDGSRAPLISVVIGVYNKKPHLAECLRSVFAQTCGDFELIIVDDASTDGSLAVIRQFQDPRIRLVVRERNSGLPAVPRNEAIRMARGEYLAFLDADDVWMPDKLARQTAFMKAHPEYPLTHTACMVMDAEGRDLYVRNHGNYPPNGDCLAELLRKTFICLSTVMVRRDLLEKSGLFSEDPGLRYNSEDQEFFLRCLNAGGGIGMPSGEILARYRWDEYSVCHHPDRWKPGLDLLGHRELWAGRMPEGEVRQIVYETAQEKAYLWRAQGRFGPARWFARQMIRLYPLRPGGWRQWLAGVFRRP